MLTLDDYMKYTELLSDTDSYDYTITVSLNTSGDILPYGYEETENTDSDSESFGIFGNIGSFGGSRFKDMINVSDFSVTGYSSYRAMLSMFGNDRTYTIVSGSIFEKQSTELQCIINDELAMFNDISVGDKITVTNPECADEIYVLTVTGIYNNSMIETNTFSMRDPANNIYMNTTALQNILAQSESFTNISDNDKEKSAVMTGNTVFTYIFDSPENYYNFENAANDMGLPENYIISSHDISAYEEATAPLDTLSKMTGWFFVIVLAIGGIILVVLNIFNLRERKYEVGVLIAIGMKKWKVATKFVCELFIIIFTAILIGAGTGAAVSVPVTNKLLESQIEKVQESNDEVSNNYGFDTSRFQEMLKGTRFEQQKTEVNYVDSVSSATDLTVIL